MRCVVSDAMFERCVPLVSRGIHLRLVSVGFVVAASVAFAVGGAFMKESDGFTRLWPSAAILVLFVVGAVLLTRAVQTDGLSTAYTIGLGVEAILSITLGVYVFGEHVSPTKLIGLSLIVVGLAGVRVG